MSPVAIRKLLAHVDADAIALTGGCAIDRHLTGSGMTRPPSRYPDVDFVAARQDAIHASVSSAFLVSHFHVPQPGYPKFLVQLVDPESGVRVDIFPDLAGAIARAEIADVAGVRLRVLAPDSLLAHKLVTLSKASPTRPVDTKHYRDAQMLAVLCGRDVPQLPAAHLCDDEYGTDVNACVRCAASANPAFPLADKRRIAELLGYT